MTSSAEYDWTKDRWSPENPSEPLLDGELDGIRSALTFYGRGHLIPRLVATLDALLAGQEPGECK